MDDFLLFGYWRKGQRHVNHPRQPQILIPDTMSLCLGLGREHEELWGGGLSVQSSLAPINAGNLS